MCRPLVLGVWRNNKLTRMGFGDFDLNNDVKILRNEILTRLNDKQPTIVLMYRGRIFEDGHPVSFYGVTPGCTIHVLQEIFRPQLPKSCSISEEQLQQLIITFKSIKTYNSPTSIRNALQRLSRPDVLENIIAATPGLSDDHTALALLKDPEIVIEILEPDTLREVAMKHPALIEATYYIAAHMYDEQIATNPNESAASCGYDYSMEPLSDDSSDTELSLPRNYSDTVITPAQLAAGIANATSVFQMPNATSSSQGPVMITNEAFNNAMLQAFASNQLPNNQLTSNSIDNHEREPSASSPNPIPLPASNRWHSQMQQMREMGLTDDTMNSRVLQATSGDLQAAVELLFDETFRREGDEI